MESVLRGEKSIDMIPFSWEEQVFYYPVRHHSPTCSWHLEKVIRKYEPDCILIEGPENANDLLPILADENTKPPVALYYSYRDDKRLLSQDKKREYEQGAENPGNDESGNSEKFFANGQSSTDEDNLPQEPESYRCYYPFLSNSPEMVALRAGKRLDIPAYFIDLSYAEILLATKAARGMRTESEKLSYASDRYLAENAFQKRLCEKAGVRSFEEFWEKYFEVGGLNMSTEDYIRQLHEYCLLSRENTPEQEMEEDGCFAREAHMAARIEEAVKKYKRVLVVTGGFHVWGLLHPIEDKKQNDINQKKIELDAQHVYPMRYSMEAADALSGYASGMPAPEFYNHVWAMLHKNNAREAHLNAYPQAVLDMLVSTGRRLRRDGSTISAFDEMCAMQMARGLADLRNKFQPGLYELQDGCLSAFVKGEASVFGTEPLRVLKRIVTGNKVGLLCDNSLVPPLVQDFEAHVKKFNLHANAVKQTVILNIFSSDKHRAMSRFFYRVSFLINDYAVRKKGPDLLKKIDRNLIRETWEYKWTSNVNSGLIDRSVSGATLEEACHVELRQRMAKTVRAEQGATLLVQSFLMGIGDAASALVKRLEILIAQDGNFASLCRACSDLNMLEELQDLYGEHGEYDYERLIKVCLNKILRHLPGMASVNDNMLHEVQKSCLLLYQLTGRRTFESWRVPLEEALEQLIRTEPLHPAMHGTALGILYGLDSSWQEEISKACDSYLRGTHEQMLKSASFLQGLFYTARDFVLANGDFVRQIDGLICNLSDEDYVNLLPELRLAFSYFTPIEQDRIARLAASLYNKGVADLKKKTGIAVENYAAGEKLDAWVASQINAEMGVQLDDYAEGAE